MLENILGEEPSTHRLIGPFIRGTMKTPSDWSVHQRNPEHLRAVPRSELTPAARLPLIILALIRRSGSSNEANLKPRPFTMATYAVGPARLTVWLILA